MDILPVHRCTSSLPVISGELFRFPKPVNFLGILPWSQKHRWQTTVQERQVCLLEDFYLPVWISRIEKKEYELYDQFLTNEEVLAKKENIHQEKLQNFRKKGVPIIENNVKIQDKGSCYEVQGSFLLELKIGRASCRERV